jgi:hypothetical protein
MADVTPISIIFTPNLLHHNNVGVTYAKTSKFIMELVKFVPLCFVAMPKPMVTITEAPFITTPAHTVVGMKFRPYIPRGTKLVNVHT